MAKFNNKYRIESTRLPEYDYSQIGYYYITICTENKTNYFGKIENDIMIHNEIGEIANKYWLEIPNHYPNVKLDEFIIMPNHIHGIIFIKNNMSETKSDASVETVHELSPPSDSNENVETVHELSLPNNLSKRNELSLPHQKSIREIMYERRIMLIPKIIGFFKMNTSKQINIINQTPGFSIWQRNYYEHIIRNEKSLYKIRHYIKYNPLNWNEDDNNLSNSKL